MTLITISIINPVVSNMGLSVLAGQAANDKKKAKSKKKEDREKEETKKKELLQYKDKQSKPANQNAVSLIEASR